MILNHIKNILLVVTACSFFACKINQVGMTHEKLNLKKIKNLELHPNVVDSKNDNEHVYLSKNKVIRYSEYNGNIIIQENLEESPYKSVKVYSLKNLLLNREERWFYDFCIGQTKIYNDKGGLTETIDCDKRYKFTVNELVEKLKNDYNIDFTSRKGNGKGISRHYLFNKDCYDIRIYLTPSAKGGVRNLIIDGTTGHVISDTVQQYNPTGDPRI